MTTTQATAARRVSYQMDTLWDFDYEPTHDELTSLYETAKKNQWNATTAIDWTRPVGKEGPVLNIQAAFQGTDFYERLTEAERQVVEVKISSWRLSQFLHGEQGALLVASQLVNPVPELDCKLYASTQVVDEGRHVEVFERYVKKLHKIYPVDPLLKGLIDRILASQLWELKLLGMQMLIEGLAIAAFNLMRRQTGDPTLASVLDYVLQDEGRHVNFGYFALKRAIPAMAPGRRGLGRDGLGPGADLARRRLERAHHEGLQPVPVHRGADPAAGTARAHDRARRPGLSPYRPARLSRRPPLDSKAVCRESVATPLAEEPPHRLRVFQRRAIDEEQPPSDRSHPA